MMKLMILALSLLLINMAGSEEVCEFFHNQTDSCHAEEQEDEAVFIEGVVEKLMNLILSGEDYTIKETCPHAACPASLDARGLPFFQTYPDACSYSVDGLSADWDICDSSKSAEDAWQFYDDNCSAHMDPSCTAICYHCASDGTQCDNIENGEGDYTCNSNDACSCTLSGFSCFLPGTKILMAE